MLHWHCTTIPKGRKLSVKNCFVLLTAMVAASSQVMAAVSLPRCTSRNTAAAGKHPIKLTRTTLILSTIFLVGSTSWRVKEGGREGGMKEGMRGLSFFLLTVVVGVRHKNPAVASFHSAAVFEPPPPAPPRS